MKSLSSMRMARRLALCFALSVLACAAQRPGGGTTGGATGGGATGGGGSTAAGTTGGATRTTIPTTPTTPTQQSTQQPDMNALQRGYFLSGRVMLDDGTVPPETVIIERVCGASRKPEAYTDHKGRFSFQLGQNRFMTPDASIGSNDLNMDQERSRTFNSGAAGTNPTPTAGMSGDQRLLGCELRAQLAGFRSDSINLSNRRMMDGPEVGTIILHRLGDVEGTTISATSLAAPKDARKAYDRGVDAAKKQKWDEAQKSFEKAVETYPKYAAAWYELGVAQQQQNRKAEARHAFTQAIQADPKYLKPYMPLAGMAMQEKNWQDVADTTSRLIRLDSADFPGALLMNAMANASLRNLDAAEKSAREAVRLDTSHLMPRAEYVLGLILANKHDYANALPLMKSYLERVPDAPDAVAVRRQIAEFENVAAAPSPQ